MTMITPMGNFPGGYRPYSTIVPNVYPAGGSLLEILESLRGWIADELVPHIDSEVGGLSESWHQNVDAVLSQVATQLTTQDADVEAIVAQLRTDVAASVESILNGTPNLGITDQIMTAVLNTVNSAANGILNGRYASKTDLTQSVAALTDSATALGLRADAALVAGLSIDRYGATGNGVADDAAAFTAAFTAANGHGTVFLNPAKTYRLATAVTVPAGVTLDGLGAKLRIVNQARVRVAGGTVRRVRFDFTTDGQDGAMQGSETAVHIQASNSRVENNTFTGNGLRYGIYLQAASEPSVIADTVIDGNYLRGTGYAIFKQGAFGTDCQRLVITNNNIKGTTQGDGIALNVGRDNEYDNVIRGNVIDDTNGTGNQGFGISLAGGSYGAAKGTQSRRFVIESNYIHDTEHAGIHVEAANSFSIRNNRISVGAENGIEVWGSSFATISGNEIDSCSGIGILDAVGYAGGYSVSTDDNLILNNRVMNCNEGLRSSAGGAGVGITIADNYIFNCIRGIYFEGACSRRFLRNLIESSTTYVEANFNHPGLSSINATTDRNLIFIDNMTINALGGQVTTGTVWNNMARESLIERDNSFDVP